MLSKNKIKYIRSLELKKKRKEEQVFVAEGHKLVGDLLGHFPCKLLIATSNWLKMNHSATANEIIEVTQEELSRASLQKTPQEVLAVFVQPSYDLNPEVIKSSLCLALDDVQDPGNLGTIIRLADWFGIEHIFCSTGTADVYNPKTVQATMGALARVKVHYCSLPQLIESLADIPVYGTFLGVSLEVEKLINNKLYIPNYPQERETSESLNVAIATAVVCSEFRRRLLP